MSDRDNSNSLLWFLAGLGFGALMGVLYAPALAVKLAMPSRTPRRKAANT